MTFKTTSIVRYLSFYVFAAKPMNYYEALEISRTANLEEIDTAVREMREVLDAPVWANKAET
jgi:hypothetical protein